MVYTTVKPERIAKVIARSGYCSRREAEKLILEGKVKVNGKVVTSPAINITDESIKINNKLLGNKEPTRLWIFHKPKGCLTTKKDPDERPTIYKFLPKKMENLITAGRLDMNTEGLLLLTNDGELARYVTLPSTAWTRKYRARVFGKIDMKRLEKLKDGITINNVHYGPIIVELDREKEFNSWLKISLKEGKNREIKKVLDHLGLKVSRLIRIAFGPFQLGKLKAGEVREVPQNVIREALGKNIK